jgi:D-inositol-3-phosphate glycosyltransferase
MRIAMLSVHTCPLAILGGKKTGGMNVYVRELSAELSRRGIQVDVYTRSQDPCVPHVNESELGMNARVIHIPAGPEQPLPTLDIYPTLPEFVENVRAFAQQEGLHYDLIHSHYWLSGWAARRLRDFWGVPFIQMFHTLGLMKNRVTPDRSRHEGELRIQTEHELMRAADALVAATPAERIQMMWLYGAEMGKIRVIPPGVDVHHFCPVPKEEAKQIVGLPSDHRMVLFVGRIEPLKGVDTLLRAIAILRNDMSPRFDNLCLAIIGGDLGSAEADDAEARRLHLLREELGLAPYVAFLGLKSQETLQYYYAAAEAVVVPSHYESFGMVALEAMACGTPVVASEVGGLAYLIQDGITGFHVPDQEPGELAGKICLLLSNDGLHREMSRNAIEDAQRYAWPRIGSQIEQLYSQTLGETHQIIAE